MRILMEDFEEVVINNQDELVIKADGQEIVLDSLTDDLETLSQNLLGEVMKVIAQKFGKESMMDMLQDELDTNHSIKIERG